MDAKRAAAWDRVLQPLVYPAGWVMKKVRWLGLGSLPRCKGALLDMGVFPIVEHYYEPRFDHRKATPSTRRLRGIDLNEAGQFCLLEQLRYGSEFGGVFEKLARADHPFDIAGGNFAYADAEFWYQLVRATKPRRIVEIGSGASTQVAVEAIRANRDEDRGYRCEHVCIEPYEAPWLETLGVEVCRKRVEELDLAFFAGLGDNDILFIDSSHMIRPGGDVLFEYLEILPSLAAGVIVHIHDVFTPRDYPAHLLDHDVLFWNEQYLLEAFLSHNARWKVIASLNHLAHEHFDRLVQVAPSLRQGNEPGSFYIQRVAD